MSVTLRESTRGLTKLPQLHLQRLGMQSRANEFERTTVQIFCYSYRLHITMSTLERRSPSNMLHSANIVILPLRDANANADGQARKATT